jgi:hypothetical protein
MTLSSGSLKSELVDKLKQYLGDPEAGDDKLQELAQAIAEAIVNHLTSNGVPTGQIIIPGGSSAGTYQLTSGAIT